MSGFSAEERAALLEPLQGLQVDPTKEGISMEQIDPGAAGTVVTNADLSAYEAEFGKKAVDRAYARGWRPKEEHRGNPENWLDPIDFFDRYADTSDRRAEKEAQKRLSAVEKTVAKRMEELAKRVDRIDETDRQATEQYYTEMLAAALPKDVPKLLKERDKALADIEAGKGGGAPQGASKQQYVAAETEDFFDKHPYLMMPSNPDDVAMRSWAVARASELEARYPNATLKQVYNQLSAEIDAKRTPAMPANNVRGGRDLASSGGGGPMPKNSKFTSADLTSDERSAFDTLVQLGAYKAGDIQKYVEGLSKTKAEEAMNNAR